MILDTVISTLDYTISQEIERTQKRQKQGVDRIRDKPAWQNYGRAASQLQRGNAALDAWRDYRSGCDGVNWIKQNNILQA